MKREANHCVDSDRITVAFLDFSLPSFPALGATDLRVSGNLPTRDAAIKGLDGAAQRIAVETEGKIRIKIHPSSQLLKHLCTFDAIARGAVDMAFVGLYGLRCGVAYRKRV